MHTERRAISRILKLAASLLTVALIPACGQTPGNAQQETTKTAQASSGVYPITVEDSVGREVGIDERPESIASMAPSVTETLFEVGAGERVSGVTTADDYPPEVKEIETVGDYRQPNQEKIIALDTDLLFISFDHSTRSEAEKLEETTGTDVVVVNPRTVDEAIDSVGLVGEAAGSPEKAADVEQDLRGELDYIRQKVSGEPEPTVFYEIYPDPLQTAGPGSFIHDAIQLAGGKNVAANTGEAYPTYSEEKLIKADPAHYLYGSLSGSTAGDIGDRAAYSSLGAVEEGNVTEIDDDLISRPGPRIVDGVRQIAKALHPEQFEE